jgi:hypothetical protein
MEGKMREVIGGCRICSKPMPTNDSPSMRRTCDACKAEQRRKHDLRIAARRKAKRHAVKAAMGVPRCEQCGEVLAEPVRLDRRFCGNTCRQAAFRARNG